MTNNRLFLFHGLLFLTVFFIAPVALPPALLFFVPLLALFANQHWALLHECIHGGFHGDRKMNNLAGRCLGIWFGASFNLVRASHLLHHQVNRTEMEQLEIYKQGKRPAHSAIISYYFNLFCGLFLSEFFGTMLFLLPQKWLESIGKRFFNDSNGFASNVFSRIMHGKGKVGDTKLDALIILFCVSLSLWLYGVYWWVLALFFVVRMVLVSFLDYAYHYGAELGDPMQGYNLWLPPQASKFILHFNLHGVHHKNPGLAWKDLPAQFAKAAMDYDGSYRAYAMRQIKGLIVK